VPAILEPDRVLRELSELWEELGRQQPEGGVLRACALTLVVLMEESEDSQATGETVARLMRDHPSRAIEVRVRAGAERVLSARVLAQCWMPFGQREQICCEQIEITVSEGALGDLAPVLPPLAAPDLPVVLWCRSPRLLELPEFPALAQAAGKLIVDSTAFPDPAAALGLLAARPASPRLADLAWTRLTRWRELIAQIFENRRYEACLGKVTAARVIFTGERPPAHAYYLAAWLLNGLEAAGSTAGVELEREPGAGDAAVTGVELTAGGLEPRRFSVRQTEAGAAEIRVDGLVNRTIFEMPDDYTLMREELSITGPDPVFERALGRAARLAGKG